MNTYEQPNSSDQVLQPMGKEIYITLKKKKTEQTPPMKSVLPNPSLWEPHDLKLIWKTVFTTLMVCQTCVPALAGVCSFCS